MSVWGAADVDAVGAGGTVSVGARDLVTPLARERAQELGVTIVVGSGTPSSAPSPGQALARAEGAPREIRPPSGALFRRGAPLPAAVRLTRDGPTGRVVVVGAGHVGMIAAMRLVDADVFAEVVLVDIDSGRAAGIALDLTHTAALGGFATRVRGVETVTEAGPADYVVITAGRAPARDDPPISSTPTPRSSAAWPRRSRSSRRTPSSSWSRTRSTR